MDDTDRQIRALVAEGFSDRQIAREVRLSRTAVRKRRAKLPAIADDTDPDWSDDDLDAGELALLDAEPVPEPVPPFRFVGFERVCLPGRKGDEPTWTDETRFIDATGRSVSELDIYRADYADGGSVGHGYLADAYRQIERTGYRQASDPDRPGFWRWEPVGVGGR
jgi:hypothetical protein